MLNLLLLAACVPAPCPQGGSASADSPAWWERERLTGDWGGARTDLEEAGVVVEVTLIQDLFLNTTGGVDTGSAHSRYLELGVGLDLEQLVGVEGATGFLQAYHTAGRGLGAKTGDFQGASNIDSEPVDILAELWWEQHVADGRLRAKVGKFDGNSEFAYTDNGGEFVNSSMGVSPTLFTIPTFPLPAWGALVEACPSDRWCVRLGLLDGAGATGLDTGTHGPSAFSDHPSSAFWIGQVDATWGDAHPGRLGVGAWLHTASFDRFDGGTEDDATGQFVVLDQHVTTCCGRELGAFAQLGLADDAVSEVGLHLGAGLVLADAETGEGFGLGATLVEFTSDPAAGFGEERELAFEAFYRAQPLGWLSVKPDVQYVVNPGGDPALDDALAVGVRLEWSF
ncbi:MAG: carbohydrate porin [Planctomycetes bacterium]|nr:carbohydrate porin [Planctomycetota bacterium]